MLLDVREAKEFAVGHLPNAVHIPLSELGSRGAELAKLTSRPVIAYCDRGQRSRAAGSVLAKLGFADIYQLTGGLHGVEGRRPAGGESSTDGAVMMYTTSSARTACRRSGC